MPALLRYVTNESGQVTESYSQISNPCILLPLNFGIRFGSLPHESREILVNCWLVRCTARLLIRELEACSWATDCADEICKVFEGGECLLELYRMYVEAFKLLSRQKP